VRCSLLAATAAGAAVSGAARADTLREALVLTYNSNPVISSQRAQLRSIDEGVAIARSGGRPQVTGNAGMNQDVTRIAGVSPRNVSAGVDLSYPLYQGGRVRNSVRAAQSRVEAGRADLRATEGDVFTEAVAAYMDVIRDRSVVTLNRNQVQVLETNLQASRDRFEVGDLTRTDVAQSEARLSLARANLAIAEGRLTASEENYRRIIGKLPDDLEPPPPLPTLPQTPDQAVDVALSESPDIDAIREQIRAAGLDVRVVRADRLPTLSTIANGSYINFLGSNDETLGVQNSQTSGAVGVQARVPIYQGGLVGARVRQQQAIQSQLIEQGVAVERSVVADVRAAFSSYQAAAEAIEANQTAVEANTLALEGTRAEQSVGTRNVLDVLNAEQELLNSQVALVTARRDAYVAGFALLNAMGEAEAEDLNLDGGALYDPAVNYRRVHRRWSDWSDDPAPRPEASRTAGPSAPALLPVGPPADPADAPPPANTP
jgi:outer membrane protein